MLLRSLLCAHVIFTDVLNLNPYDNFSQRQFCCSHSLLGFVSFCGWDLCLLSVANYNTELVSLNAQGINGFVIFKSVKAIFTWIKKQKANSAFLQETQFL